MRWMCTLGPSQNHVHHIQALFTETCIHLSPSLPVWAWKPPAHWLSNFPSAIYTLPPWNPCSSLHVVPLACESEHHSFKKTDRKPSLRKLPRRPPISISFLSCKDHLVRFPGCLAPRCTCTPARTHTCTGGGVPRGCCHCLALVGALVLAGVEAGGVNHSPGWAARLVWYTSQMKSFLYPTESVIQQHSTAHR